MSSKNRHWNVGNITAGIFIAVVAGLIGHAIHGAQISRTAETSTSTVTVTATPPPATVTVTATPTADDPQGGATGTSKPVPSPSGSESGGVDGSSPEDTLLLAPLKPADGYQFGRDQSYRIGTVLYPHSLSTFCHNFCLDNPKYVEYGISEGYTRFTAKVGIDGDKGSSNQVVIFRVKLIGAPEGDDQIAFEKTISLGGETDIDIPLKGAVRIRMETVYGGSDSKDAIDLSLHPVWGTPTLHRK